MLDVILNVMKHQSSVTGMELNIHVQGVHIKKYTEIQN